MTATATTAMPGQQVMWPVRVANRLGTDAGHARRNGDDATADGLLADLRYYLSHMVDPRTVSR